MPKPRRIAGCLLATALQVGVAGTGCSVNPVSRQPEMVLVSEQSELEQGRQAAEQVAQEMGLVENAALTSYLSAVGDRLLAHAPDRGFGYHFAIIDQDEPNAFALPGGYVYVSRGLLSIANAEAELAGVLAHEIVHVAARHHARRQTRAAGVGLLALPGLLAGALIGGPVGDLVSAPFAVAGTGLLAGYSREQETEADRVGQEIAARAGYDPRGLAAFLVTLERDTELRVGKPRIPGFFDTHPSTPRRAAQAAGRAAGLPFETRRPVAGSHDGFLKRLDGVLVGDNPAEGVFEGQTFLHPDLGFALEFPDGWTTVNTRRAVGAVAERGDTQVVLRQQGPGTDPREASSAFLSEASQQMRIDVARLDREEINGLQAVRGQVVAGDRRGSVSLDLTWIAHGGSIYLISGAVERGYSDVHRALFGRVARSFRPLRPAERERITEARVRLRPARSGEDLGSLGARTGNDWSIERTAVVNALDPSAALAEGRLVKVAVRQRYPGGSGPAAPPR